MRPAFSRTLQAAADVGRPAVIAEIKARDGTGRDLLAGRSVAALVRSYERGGAACLSAVTGRWFGGTPDLLDQVLAAARVPVLWKDFVHHPRQIEDAARRGVGAVLLSVAALVPQALKELVAVCKANSVDAFVEVANERELCTAAWAEADVIAVNNKDIATRERVGEGVIRSGRLARMAPRSLMVSASGIDEGGIEALAGAGFSGFLVGTTLLQAGDAERATRRLVAAAAGVPSALRDHPLPLVKICGLRDQRELDVLVRVGADLGGLCVLPEPAGLSPSTARHLAAGCGAELTPVLVTVAAHWKEAASLIEETEIRTVQLSGLMRPTATRHLRDRFGRNLVILQVIHARGSTLLQAGQLGRYADAGVDMFVLDAFGGDGALGSTGTTVGTEAIARFVAENPGVPTLLAGGLRPGNLRDPLTAVLAVGADVSTGVRAADGSIDEQRVGELTAEVRHG